MMENQDSNYRFVNVIKREFEKTTPQVKVTFIVSVLALIVQIWAVCVGQWFLPWYYSILCPALIIWRVYSYWQVWQQYFCLDFCYFGNSIIVLILWFCPESPELFAVQHSVSHGMLYLGAFMFFNKLVFHSVDKMTSSYIHIAPVLLTFGIRWFPSQASSHWHSDFPKDFIPFPDCWKWNILAPVIILIVHTLIYFLLVFVILRPEEGIITSFRWMERKAHKIKNFGPHFTYPIFVGGNIILCLIFSALTMVTYSYFIADVIAIMLVFAFISVNGALFYLDIIRKSFPGRSEGEISHNTGSHLVKSSTALQ